MSETKDSGIKSVGEIPSDWKVLKVRNLFRRKKEVNTAENPIVLSLSREAVKIRDISNNEGQLAESYDHYHIVNKGDLLLNPMDLYSGANCNVSFVDGVISPAYFNLTAKLKLNPRYFDYYFKHQYWAFEMFSNGKGVSFDNRWTLNYENLMSYKLVCPTVAEQDKIVAYIETMLTRIDTEIAKNKRAIELLWEYRASMIDEYTTPQKHWETEKLKYSFDFGKGLSIAKENLVEEGLPVISYGQIHSKSNTGTTITDDLLRFVSESYLSCKNSLVNKGDFIFADKSENLDGVGNCVYVDRDGVLFAGYCTLILRAKNSDSKFFSYLFKSNRWRSQLRSMVDGIKLFSITRRILSQVNIVIPPKDEQEKIVVALDKKSQEIDQIIVYRKTIIERLEEYKKSLIYEVVTGKKEV